jgi:RNA polymerase sigma-70 factor (ECF subfamily)
MQRNSARGFGDGGIEGRAMRTIPSVTDTGLHARPATASSAASFESLVRQYERPLYGFIYRMMGNNPDDAADLLQETFIKVYRALDRVPPNVNFGAWLYRIARNCCFDELRRRKRGYSIPWDGANGFPMIEPSLGMDPEVALLQREGDGFVSAVLARMSRRNREALILRECAGLSCEEIGLVFGISRKAVKSMLFRAREEFRRVTQTLGLSAMAGETPRWYPV